MLSLASTFRAATRRQTCTACAVTARSMSNGPNSFRDLGDIVRETSEARDAVQEDGIIDSVPAPTMSSPNGFQVLRGFHPHEFVQPKDFSRAQLNKQRTYLKKPALGPDARASRYLDPFHQLGIDPLKESLNSALLSRFVTSMGKIKKRSETNLTWRNQRRVGKAIRRAKMMGIIPVLSRRQLFDASETA